MKYFEDDENADRRDSAAFLVDRSLDYLYSAALRAAAASGVADEMSDTATPLDILAAATDTEPGALYRVLRLLATRGLVEEDECGCFRLMSLGRSLRTDDPFSVRSAVLMLTAPAFWYPTVDLAQCLDTGGSSFEEKFGMPFFDYFSRDADTSAIFHEGMAAMSAVENGPIAATYRFPESGTVVDVGGGHGGFLAAVIRANPGLCGVLFERPHVLSGHQLGVPELAGRWNTIEGDFFAFAPAGDIYLLKRILHDWDDANCVTILRHCRAALSPAGRVLVVDAVIPKDNKPHQGKGMDLLMMASLTGRERTRQEFAALFQRARLKLVRVISTRTALSIIEAAAA